MLSNLDGRIQCRGDALGSLPWAGTAALDDVVGCIGITGRWLVRTANVIVGSPRCCRTCHPVRHLPGGLFAVDRPADLQRPGPRLGVDPVETGYFSLRGAKRQWGTIQSLIERIGRPIECSMLPTLHNPDSRLSSRILEPLGQHFPDHLLPMVIREHEPLREAASLGQPHHRVCSRIRGGT